jgi:hypothetical protein
MARKTHGKRERIEPDYHILAARGELQAPRGRYRVIGATFEGPTSDFLVGDFSDRGKALAEVEAKGKVMTPYYVYNDSGRLIFAKGRF